MIFPAGFRFRIRSTPDAKHVSECLDLPHLRQGREIVLTEEAELTRLSFGKPKSDQVRALVSAWEQFRRKLVAQGILNVPPDLLPLAQAIDRLKAA